MYLDLIKTIGEKIKPLRSADAFLIELCMDGVDFYSTDKSVLFASAKDGFKEVIGVLMKLCPGCDLLGGIDLSESELPLLIKIVGNDSPYIIDETVTVGESEHRQITIHSDSEYIHKAGVCYYCGFDFSELGAATVTSFDRIVLFTNALMSMTAQEKKWLEKTVEHYHGSDGASVVLFNGDKLNTDEDFDTVCTSAESFLSKAAPGADFYDSPDGFTADADSIFEISDELVEKGRAARVRLMLDNIAEIAESRLEEIKNDSSEVQQIIRKIDMERKFITAASVVAVNSRTDTLYRNLKTELCDAADAFIDDAYESIRERISSTNELERDVELVPSYLQKVLKVFEEKSQEKIVEDHMKITEKLESQLEADCKALVELGGVYDRFKDMPESEINLGAGGSFERYNPDDDERFREFRTASRGFLSASTIGTIIISPVFGGLFLLGKYLYEKYSKGARDEAARKAFLEHLDSDCEELKIKLIGMLYKGLSELEEETKVKLSESYRQVIDNTADMLIDHFEKKEKIDEEQKAVRDLLTYIEEVKPLI